MKFWLVSFYCVVLLQIVAFAQDTTRLSMVFVGDIMGHDSQIASAYSATTNAYDYESCFQYVEPLIKSADLAFGNLEVTLAGKPYKGYPQFSSPDELAVALKKIGFDVLVTANNHSLDRRKSGLERTIRVLDSLAILHTGTFVDTVSRMNDYPLILTKNGFRIALLNYTYGTNGIPTSKPNIVNYIDTVVMKKDLEKMKAYSPDIIISFLHWGNEYQSLPSAFQKKIATFCFKHGSDLVIGAHPHVIQPMEWNKEENRAVVYSLGNFVSGQRKRYTDGGVVVRIELEKILKNDSVRTQIDSVGYTLVWVHRDEAKKYTLLPSSFLLQDSLTFSIDKTSKDAFDLFVDDGHTLLTKHNINVQEYDASKMDSISYFTIELLGLRQSDLDTITNNKVLFYGMEKSHDENNNVRWQIGSFRNHDQAEALRKELEEQFPAVTSKIIRYVNGERTTH